MFEGGGGTDGGFNFVDRVRETQRPAWDLLLEWGVRKNFPADREGKTLLRDRKLRGGVQGGDLRLYGRFAPRTALNW